MDFNTLIENIVFIITPFENNKVNNKISSFNIITENTSVNNYSNIFVLNITIIKHICYNLAYFSNFRTYNKIIN